MKAKTIKIIYWILLILFVVFMFVDGVTGVMQLESGKEAMAQLGYPNYLMHIVGIAKILGALVLIQHKFKTVREWAYAGFVITFVGASASWAFSNGPLPFILMPLIFVLLTLSIYFMGKKVASSSCLSAEQADFKEKEQN